jgi:hypothetical protein
MPWAPQPVAQVLQVAPGTRAANERLALDAEAAARADTLGKALNEALDAIEQIARYSFLVGDEPVSQEQFERIWRATDEPDYERWVRLKRVALDDSSFREDRELEDEDGYRDYEADRAA